MTYGNMDPSFVKTNLYVNATRAYDKKYVR